MQNPHAQIHPMKQVGFATSTHAKCSKSKDSVRTKGITNASQKINQSTPVPPRPISWSQFSQKIKTAFGEVPSTYNPFLYVLSERRAEPNVRPSDVLTVVRPSRNVLHLFPRKRKVDAQPQHATGLMKKFPAGLSKAISEQD